MENVAIMDNGNRRNESWDAVWDCRTKANEKYWTAEIGIPFSQLRPGSDFYLVFNQIYDSNSSNAKLAGTTFVGKMNYWWNP